MYAIRSYYAAFAVDEMVKIDVVDREAVRDHVVIRVPKTYPAYFGSYNRFGEVQAFVDEIPNLFLVGRNGMHKYNNQDRITSYNVCYTKLLRSASTSFFSILSG